uniref:Lipopolysaccharide-binding protein n=1 Tax=Equus asinus asinus TaxID=83772 RepID=A0A8C4PF33_EQUAS
MEASAGTLFCLLLILLSTPGALGSNPGLVARITDKGLEYVAKEGAMVLQRKLRGISLPDFTGDFKIRHLGRVHYEFHSLDISSCELLGSALMPLPGQGLRLTLYDSFIGAHGKWKVRKSFLKLDGSFDVGVKDITISVDLLLGSEPSGRPTVTVSSCSSHISDVEGTHAGFLFNFFQICEKIQNSVTSDLQPYLQTLPVTTEIDNLTSIDYSLMEAPRVTDHVLDVMFKGEIFNHDHRSPVTFVAPAMSLPEEHSRMVYFAISDYVFNTASLVYQEAGYLNFSITDDMVRMQACIFPSLDLISSFCPQLAKLYPNMNLELQGAVVPAPFLNFSPGNLSLAPNMEIDAFVLLPSSAREPVFRLGVVSFKAFANFCILFPSLTSWLIPSDLDLNITSSESPFLVALTPDPPQAPCPFFLVTRNIFLHGIYNKDLAKGLPLPLLKHIRLYDLVLQIHKVSGFMRGSEDWGGCS